MLAQISTPPTFITPEQHAEITSSTPVSFGDILPVLRWQDDVEVIVNSRTWSGWAAGARIPGHLWVTENEVAFLPSPESQAAHGFSIVYDSLSMHALTPSTPDAPAHIYCQIDDSLPINGGTNAMEGVINGGTVAEDGEDEFTPMIELSIFVVGENKHEPLFAALSDCSALHASLLPNGESSSFFGGLGGGEWYTGEDDEDDEEEEEDDNGAEEDGAFDDAEGEDGSSGPGRVRSDFHSGGGPAARFRPY